MLDKIYRWRLIILSLVFWIITFINIPSEFIDLGGDSVQYVILAESIKEGKGLSMVNYPQSPPSELPPFFPLILASALSVFGRDFFVIHLLVAVMAYLALFFFYRIFEREAGTKVAVFSVIVLAWSRLFFFYSFRVLTEIPFICLCGFTLYFLIQYKKSEKILSREGILASLGLILTYLCRYIGVTLFFAVFFDCLLGRDWRKIQLKKILFLMLTLLPVIVIWAARNAHVDTPHVTPIFQQFLYVDFYRPHLGLITQRPSALLARMANNLIFYFYVAGEAVFSSLINRTLPSVLKIVLYFSCIVLVFMRIISDLRRKKFLLFNFFIIYIFFLLVWPFREDGRYFLPLVPLVIFYFMASLNDLLRFLKKGKYVFYAVCAVILVAGVSSLPIQKYTYDNLHPYFKDFISINQWVAENLPPQGIVISRKSRLTYFYSGHQSLGYPFSNDPDEIWLHISANNARYIVVDPFSRETRIYLWPFINKYKSKLKVLHRIGNAGVLEVVGN